MQCQKHQSADEKEHVQHWITQVSEQKQRYCPPKAAQFKTVNLEQEHIEVAEWRKWNGRRLISESSCGYSPEVDSKKFLSNIKMHFSYVKSNIPCNWSNIICTCYLTMLTPENPYFEDPFLPCHPASNLTHQQPHLLPDPACHQSQPATPLCPAFLPSQPASPACLPVLLRHNCVTNVANLRCPCPPVWCFVTRVVHCGGPGMPCQVQLGVFHVSAHSNLSQCGEIVLWSFKVSLKSAMCRLEPFLPCAQHLQSNTSSPSSGHEAPAEHHHSLQLSCSLWHCITLWLLYLIMTPSSLLLIFIRWGCWESDDKLRKKHKQQCIHKMNRKRILQWDTQCHTHNLKGHMKQCMLPSKSIRSAAVTQAFSSVEY